MVTDPVADRYASALFDLVDEQGQLDDTLAHLEQLGVLLQSHPELRQFLINPDVELPGKIQVLGRVLAGAWSEDVKAFLQVVLSMGRAESLGEMVEAFRASVDAKRRRVRVTVRVARPLSKRLRDRLKQRLEQLEQREVELDEATDPTLIGGMQIFLDHRLLDGSLRSHLEALRRQLKSVRVH